jgi:hypothetical protein
MTTLRLKGCVNLTIKCLLITYLHRYDVRCQHSEDVFIFEHSLEVILFIMGLHCLDDFLQAMNDTLAHSMFDDS